MWTEDIDQTFFGGWGKPCKYWVHFPGKGFIVAWHLCNIATHTALLITLWSVDWNTVASFPYQMGLMLNWTILFEICSSWIFRPLKMRPLHCLKTSGTQWCNVTSQKNRNLVISTLKMLEFTFNLFFKWFIHYICFCCDLYITLHSNNSQASPVLKLSSALYCYWDWCTVSSELVFWTCLYRMGMKVGL